MTAFVRRGVKKRSIDRTRDATMAVLLDHAEMIPRDTTVPAFFLLLLLLFQFHLPFFIFRPYNVLQ